MNRKVIDRVNILYLSMPDKELLSRICRPLLQLNSKKTQLKSNFKKWIKDMNKLCKKEGTQKANKHMYMCLILFISKM